MENNQLDLSFFPLTSFSSDAKLFGEEKRRNDRSKLRRKAEEKIINRFNELCPEAMTAKLDLIIDDTVVNGIQKFIDEMPISGNLKKNSLNFLIRVFGKGQKEFNWQVKPPPFPFIIRSEFNPLTNQNFKSLANFEKEIKLFEESFLDGSFETKLSLISKESMKDKQTELIGKLVWGRYFYTCARFSGLLETKSFVELAFGEVKIYQLNKYVWMDLFVKNETKLQRPLRRFFPEELAIILWQQIQSSNISPPNLSNDKDKIKWVESSIQEFRSFLSCEFKKTSYRNWLTDMKTWHGFALPPILMGIASGRQISTAFFESVWLRIISNRKIKTLPKIIEEPHQDWESTYNFIQASIHDQNRKYDTEYKKLTSILRIGKNGQKRSSGANVEPNRNAQRLRSVLNEFIEPPLIIQALVFWLIKKLEVDKVAKSTAYQYLTNIGTDLIDRLANVDLTSLDAETFLGVYKEILENSNAKSSNQDKIQQLQQFHRFLVVHLGVETVDFRLDDELCGISNANARFLTEREFNICMKEMKNKRSELHDEMCELACLISYRCGLRISETATIRFRDLHFVENKSTLSCPIAATLKVRSNPYNQLKTTNANRLLPVHLLLTKSELIWLADYCERRKLLTSVSSADYLFYDHIKQNTPLNTYQICNHVIPVLREVTGDVEITFHQLRHSFCCQLFALLFDFQPISPLPPHWINIQDSNHRIEGNLKSFLCKHSKHSRNHAYQIMTWMGHASPSMSLSAYMHWSDYLIRQCLDKFRIEHQSRVNDPLNNLVNAIHVKKVVKKLLNINDDIYRQLKENNAGDMKLAVAKRCKVEKISIREHELIKEPSQTLINQDNLNKTLEQLSLIEWINFLHVYRKTLDMNKVEQVLYLKEGSARYIVEGLKRFSAKGSKGGYLLLFKPSTARESSKENMDFYAQMGFIFPEPPKNEQQRLSEIIFAKIQRLFKKDGHNVSQALDYFIRNFRVDGGYTLMDGSLESSNFQSVVKNIIPPELSLNEVAYLKPDFRKAIKGQLSVRHLLKDSWLSCHGFRYAMMIFWLSKFQH